MMDGSKLERGRKVPLRRLLRNCRSMRFPSWRTRERGMRGQTGRDPIRASRLSNRVGGAVRCVERGARQRRRAIRPGGPCNQRGGGGAWHWRRSGACLRGFGERAQLAREDSMRLKELIDLIDIATVSPDYGG